MFRRIHNADSLKSRIQKNLKYPRNVSRLIQCMMKSKVYFCFCSHSQFYFVAPNRSICTWKHFVSWSTRFSMDSMGQYSPTVRLALARRSRWKVKLWYNLTIYPSFTGSRDNAELRGVIPNAIDHIFQHIAQSKNQQYLVRASYLEIYQVRTMN